MNGNWLLIFAWITAFYGAIQWFVRWRLVGGLSLQRCIRELRRSLGNAQRPMILAGMFAVVMLPLNIAFDLAPPLVISLQIPLGLNAILGLTAPVSFLVLGPSRSETAQTCGKLVRAFLLLRPGAAVNPKAFGAVRDFNFGASGNLWMAAGNSWQEKVAQMIKDAPLVIFDARVITDHTRWELFHILGSGHLPKTIIVGPVGEGVLADFLSQFDGVPVINSSILINVIRAASTRPKLLKWHARRRHSTLLALQRIRLQGSPAGPTHTKSGIYLNRFYADLPNVISQYDPRELTEKANNE